VFLFPKSRICTVALWSIIPVIVKEDKIGRAFGIMLCSQSFAEVLVVILGTWLVSPDHSSTPPHPIVKPGHRNGSFDVAMLIFATLGMICSVWLVYIDESGNGTKSPSRSKSHVPFTPFMARMKGVYLPGALRRIVNTSTLAALLDCEDDVDRATGCATPDLEVEINTMINKTSGKWESDQHHRTRQTVCSAESRGRAGSEESIGSSVDGSTRSNRASPAVKGLSGKGKSSRARMMSSSFEELVFGASFGSSVGSPASSVSSVPLRGQGSGLGGEVEIGARSLSPPHSGTIGGGGGGAKTGGGSGILSTRSRFRHAAVAAKSETSERTPLLSSEPRTTTNTAAEGIPTGNIPRHVKLAYDGEDEEVAYRVKASLVPGSLPTQTLLDKLKAAGRSSASDEIPISSGSGTGKGVKFSGDVDSFPERRIGDGQHPRIPPKKKRAKSEDFPMRYYSATGGSAT
jgi:hypothetical protein